MRLLKRPDVIVPLSFMIVGLLWIVMTDQFLLRQHTDISLFELTRKQSVKGAAFIVCATLFIYGVISLSNKQLIKSEKEYRDLFYNTPNPMMIFDLKTRTVCDVNEAAVETYGYSAEEFTKLSIDEVRLNQYQETKTQNIYEHKKKDNQVIICLENSRQIMFKNSPACLLSTNEITELENTKAELGAREKQLQKILNSITDGFFILTPDMKVKKANETFQHIVNVPMENVEDKKISELFPQPDLKPLFDQYAAAIQNQQELHIENYYSPSKIWSRISAYPFEGDLCIFFRDITAEKSERLHSYQNEQNLIALINNTEDYIWSIDNEFRYFTFNEPYRRAYKMLFKEDLWIGKTALNEIQGDEHIAKWKELYERSIKGEKFAVDMDFIIDDQCLFTTVRFNPIYSLDGKVTGVGCFLQNITERKLYESKIELQNEKLKQIAFITSHKVRAPLANILGLSEVLDPDNPFDATNAQIIAHIKTSAKQLDLTIINMVQETAQLEI